MRATSAFILAAACAVAAPAHADDGARWALTLGVAQSQYDGASGAVLGVPYRFDGGSTGWRFDAAFRAIGPLWVEAGYRDLGTLEGAAAFCDVVPNPTTCEPVAWSRDGTGRTLALRGSMALGERWSLAARWGRVWTSGEERHGSSSLWPPSSAGESDSGSALGFEVAYAFSERFSAVLGAETFDGMETTLLDSSATLGIRFTP